MAKRKEGRMTGRKGGDGEKPKPAFAAGESSDLDSFFNNIMEVTSEADIPVISAVGVNAGPVSPIDNTWCCVITEGAVRIVPSLDIADDEWDTI